MRKNEATITERTNEYEKIVSNVCGPDYSEHLLVDDLVVCDCAEGDCTLANGCECVASGSGLDNYTESGSLLHEGALIECGNWCECVKSGRCPNRVVGNGSKPGLIRLTENVADLGVIAEETIPANSFVIEYIGEVIGEKEARNRERQHKGAEHHYIFTVLEVIQGKESLTFIDPRKLGNIARFINHSCDPNLKVVIVRRGCLSPSAALFASRDIMKGEQLSFDYGWSAKSGFSTKDCLCGAKNCRGKLPSKDVSC
ncbi:unnamed protein product, partial [Mesorhabditis spiculigera]